jgi:hypothetical protein
MAFETSNVEEYNLLKKGQMAFFSSEELRMQALAGKLAKGIKS